jgi:hypothetical protein
MIMSAPALFGSMNLLGNPTQLIGSVARGLQDLVRLPTRALTQGQGFCYPSFSVFFLQF